MLTMHKPLHLNSCQLKSPEKKTKKLLLIKQIRHLTALSAYPPNRHTRADESQSSLHISSTHITLDHLSSAGQHMRNCT